MVAAVTNILSLSAARRELRLAANTSSPYEADEIDAILTPQLEAAGAWIAGRLQYPLVDTAVNVPAGLWYDGETIRPHGEQPLSFFALSLQTLTGVQYWERGDRDGDPTDTITTWGAWRRGRSGSVDNGNHYLWPDTGGWPEPYTAVYAVQGSQGLSATDPALPAIRQAMTLLVREFFEGRHEIKRTHAVFTLLAPHMRYVPALSTPPRGSAWQEETWERQAISG